MAKFLVEVIATEEIIQEWMVEADNKAEAEARWFNGDLTNTVYNDTLSEEVTNITEIKGRNEA